MTKVEKRFTVSRMTEADAAEAAVIDAEVYTTPWSERSFSDSLKKDCYLFLTVRGKGPEILGYCGLVQSFDEADITNVTVRSKARGQGIAFLMLNELMEEGRKRGISRFSLEVRASNQPAIRLYRKLGFCQEGRRKNFYSLPEEDALIFWKDETRADG